MIHKNIKFIILLLNLQLVIPLYSTSAIQQKQSKKQWYQDIRTWIATGAVALAAVIGISIYGVKRQKKNAPRLEEQYFPPSEDSSPLSRSSENNYESIGELQKKHGELGRLEEERGQTLQQLTRVEQEKDRAQQQLETTEREIEDNDHKIAAHEFRIKQMQHEIDLNNQLIQQEIDLNKQLMQSEEYHIDKMREEKLQIEEEAQKVRHKIQMNAHKIEMTEHKLSEVKQQRARIISAIHQSILDARSQKDVDELIESNLTELYPTVHDDLIALRNSIESNNQSLIQEIKTRINSSLQ